MQTIILFSALCVCNLAHTLEISFDEVQKLAQKIWQNECQSKVEGLTTWNSGEEFASLGIGHFIWYPAGKTKTFKETFPELIRFFKKNHVKIPSWIKEAEGCPWQSKELFDKALESVEMQTLRQLLVETQSLQALFILQRLENALKLITAQLSVNEAQHVTHQFQLLAEGGVSGLYVLLDYLNFKGEGILESERYEGKGWGLLQVLLEMPHTDSYEKALPLFVEAAKKILERRVSLAPKERNEERWLKGWNNRLDSYLL
jgi:hypothetical protein